jgi:nucleotide-binding universal stress UspA family protein
MKIPEKVLVVLNDTEWQDTMRKTVMNLSGKYGSAFSFLHVFPEKEEDNDDLPDRITKFNIDIKETKIKFLDQDLEFGEFQDVILKKTEKTDPDIILIDGGKNNTHVEEFILDIIPETECSVWTLERSQSPGLNKILCPVDFSNTSQRALQDALILAKDFDAELRILTVNDFTESTSVFMEDTVEDSNKESIEAGKRDIDSLLKEMDTKGINLNKKVRLGDPAEEIDKEIIEWDADLLVIGTHGRSGIEKKLIGSITEKVLKKAACSFLALKSERLFDK